MKRTAKYLGVTILPLGVLIALMYYYAVDLPFYDEWTLMPFVAKFHEGTLSWRDIFAQHNEHRIILGKIIMLANAVLTNWNTYYELAVNVLFGIGTSIIIFCALEGDKFVTGIKKLIIQFTASCLVFSFSQFENWLWGFQMQILMCVFFVVLSAYLLSRERILGAIIFAVLATYSFANGMIIWPAGFIALCIDRKRPARIALWVTAAVICIVPYFYGFNFKTDPYFSLYDRVIFILTHLHIFFILFMSYLGAPLANYRQSMALGAGVIGMCIQAYCIWILVRNRRWDRNLCFWAIIDLFIIASAGITSLGRFGTVSSTMAMRYISFSMLFWLCTIYLAATSLEIDNHIPVKLYLTFAAIILSLSLSEHYLIVARERNEELNLFKAYMHKGMYDERVALNFLNRSNLSWINLARKYNIRHFENAPVIEPLHDFVPYNINPENILDGSSAHITDFYIRDERFGPGNFLHIDGWLEGKSECFLVLYDGDNAFRAELRAPFPKQRLVLAKYPDAFEAYNRTYFSSMGLCFDGLPAGDYRVLIGTGDKYLDINQRVQVK